LYRWKELTSDSRILSWIKGYVIPFSKPVLQKSKPKEPLWSIKEKAIIQDQVEKLILKGAISQCQPCRDQFLSGIFLIDKPDGSYRLILNLKDLNRFITTEHFKLEDFKVACRLISPDCFMGKLDLKEAYYLIPVDKSNRKYLRFSFNDSLYEFNCLPFGLNTAPYVFTKILKPVVGYLRNLGFLSVIYLDDLLLIGNTYSECSANINASVELLQNLGFIVNEEKSCKIPSKNCKFLGFVLNSQTMTLELPSDKRCKIRDQITKFRKLKQCKIRKFAQLIGSLVACCPAIQYGWAHIKNAEREKYLALLKANGNYEALMNLDQELQEDFLWWEKNIVYRVYNISNREFKLVIFSDASLTGWGVACDDCRTHGHWNETERSHHINYLELLAAFFGLRCFAKDFRNCNILLRLDNTTAIAYINRMGGVRFKKLSNLSKMIWKWCEDREIHIFASYIPSRDNTEADSESRKSEKETEFELSEVAFRKIVKEFGSPEIDLFATRINAKCKDYVSWMRDPDALAIDAFTLNWNSFFFYAFPPFALINRVLQKIKAEKAKGILVAPYWPVQPWFPMYCSMLESEPLILKANRDLLLFSDREPHPLWRTLSLVAGKLSGRPS